MNDNRRMSQRDIKPSAVKFRIMEFFDPSDGTYKFKDNDGNAIFTIDPADGTIAFGSALTFSTAVTFSDTVTFSGNSSFTGDVDISGVLSRAVFTESFGAELTTGGTALASDETAPNQTADEAFDDDPITKWLAETTSTPWLQYQLAATKIVRKYVIIAGDDNNDRDPKTWVFQGSNNGTDFVTLDTQTAFWFGPRSIRKEFYIDNTTTYTYYRLDISENWGSADTQLAELQLYEQS